MLVGMRKLLTRLANLPGTSGREQSIASVVREELERSADEVKTDRLGNLIATKKGSGEFSLMLAAHIDEIGLAIEKVDGEGFAYPSRVGGWNPQVLPSKSLKSEKGWGVASVLPLDLMDEENRTKGVKSDDLFVDGDEISVGDFMVFDVSVAELGNPNLLVGKSFDDRAGVTVLIEVFNRMSDDVEFDVYGVATVQEEVGARGAGVAAYKLNPDLALVLETALADDVPTDGAHTPSVRLGGGPAITVKDASVISHPGLTNYLVRIAEKLEIPHQLEILERGGTDAGRIHLVREGIPSSVVGVPTRYLHSSVEVLDLRDLERSVDLVTSTLEELTRPEFESLSSSGRPRTARRAKSFPRSNVSK